MEREFFGGFFSLPISEVKTNKTVAMQGFSFPCSLKILQIYISPFGIFWFVIFTEW